MTLEAAMTDLSIQLAVQSRLGYSYHADAIKLGIEALKRQLQCKRSQNHIDYLPMPGETTE